MTKSLYSVHLDNSTIWHEIFVSKKSPNNNQALQKDLTNNLWIKWIKSLQVFSNYVVAWLNDDEFEKTTGTVLSEAPVDQIYNNDEFQEIVKWKKIIVIEAKPWQLDLTVEWIDFNNKLITHENTKNRFKKVIVLEWDLSEKDLNKIKKYLINPNENFESSLEDKKIEREIQTPKNHIVLEGFIDLKTDEEFKDFIKKHSLLVEFEDIKIVQDYFKNVEKRNPTKVEMLLIGTYWSDHCRHTTFETQITNLKFDWTDEKILEDITKFNNFYDKKKEELGKKDKNTFMQIAKSSLSFLKTDPEFEQLELMDISEEDNAASYKLKIELENGEKEDWIIMFKNETHNSPTETEPFGWAATALWGSIRDILSGRSMTFSAMRISGAEDPTKPVSETLAWKVSQLALSIGSALGAASYWNQIWVPTTNVLEYFHPWFVAKRFECSYVLWAVKEENIVRKTPIKWDLIIMAWWKTWRDGIGWAVVSSAGAWEHSEDKMWAHVQKWNPLNERPFQRLMKRYPEWTKMIKKSNDFGAGWVSVAIWELSRWVNVFLDEVAKHTKYAGLSDEELTISESQERMSFVISPENKEKFLEILKKENVEAFVVWEITTDKKDEDRLVINYKWKKVVDLSRNFLDQNGAKRTHDAVIKMNEVSYFDDIDLEVQKLIKEWKILEAVKLQLSFKENSSQRILQRWFDSSVLASTILAPYGWKYQDSPQGKKMVNKIPTSWGIDSKTAIISSHGFNPSLMCQNTYIGWMYAVLEAISQIVATGWNYKKSWLSLQEYFWKLTSDEKYWEVYAGLLGTLKSLINLKVGAIWWKDSMSGTYVSWNLRIDVPPTIVAFANCPVDSEYVVSSEFKKAWNKVLHFKLEKDENWLPEFEKIKSSYETIYKLIQDKKVFSSSVLANGGIIEAVAKLSLWNRIWFKFENISEESFKSNIWDILLEVDEKTAKLFPNLVIWETTDDNKISFGNESLEIQKAKELLEWSLEKVWNPKIPEWKVDEISLYRSKNKQLFANTLKSQPIALIPVFPWTNSDDDAKHQLEKAWFVVEEHIFNTTWTEQEQKQSRIEFAEKLKNADLFVLAWWFSFWDEPWASWKSAVNILKSAEIRNAVQTHYNDENKLTIWICNGAQMLIKQWIIDDSKIKDELKQDDAIIAHNDRWNHETWLVKLKVVSNLSPFFTEKDLWKEFMINISHWEWKFQMPEEKLEKYVKNGQVALQYLDEEWNPTNKYNGSMLWIAWMTDPTWRILFMMPHPERIWLNVMKNVPGEKNMQVFKNAYNWFVGNK